MTLSKAISHVRSFARAKSSGKTATEIMEFINEGMMTFAKDVHNLVKEEYIAVQPRFNLDPTIGIRLTITGGTNALTATDIAVSDEYLENQTGTQVATELQAQIRTAIGGSPSLTVAWSTTLWKFTINAVNSSAILIETPTGLLYGDGLSLLGFENDDSGTTSIAGGLPIDCTIDADLPSDFINLVRNPTWDGYTIRQSVGEVFESPQVSGNPNLYFISDKKIRLYPTPAQQKPLHIRYRYLPELFDTVNGYQECGLTGKHATTATGLSTSTQYYFKITVDEGTQDELSITTASDVRYAAVITLINAALAASTNSSGCTASLEDGDLRFTSSGTGNDSLIALAAGTSGTNFFVTLTGFTAFDTAVEGQSGDTMPINEEDCMTVIFYAAFLCLTSTFETDEANSKYALYMRGIQNRRSNEMQKNTKIEYREPANSVLNHEVTID